MIRTVSMLALAGLLLAACGLRGPLERPMPLWGDPPRDGPDDPRTIKELEEKAQAEAEAAKAAKQAEAAAQTTPAAEAGDTPQ
ncbi:MAG: lipoprotein [Hyphomonadaceae bacterium]